MKLTPILLTGLLALSGASAALADSAPPIVSGLSSQPTQRLAFTFDRLDTATPPTLRLVLTSASAPSRFLGAEARFDIYVSSWQLWLLMHPEATSKDDIPVDQATHEDIHARVVFTYFKGATVVAEVTALAQTQVGAFVPAIYCSECSTHALQHPAEIAYRTDNLAIPTDGGIDRVVVKLQALEYSTGRLSSQSVTIEHPLLLNGDPVHVYVSGQMFLERAPFHILDAETLRADKPTTFLYSNERPTSYLTYYDRVRDEYRLPDFMTALQDTILCHDRTGQRPPIHADAGLLKATTAFKYRVDGGAWSNVASMTENLDRLSPVVFPFIWEGLSGFTLPAFQRGQVVELAFRMQPIIDVDGRNDCTAQGGANFERHFPYGHKILMPERWETPSMDETTGWTFEVL